MSRAPPPPRSHVSLTSHARSQEVQQTSEEERDVLQLGDVVLSVAAVLAEQRQVLQVLSAGVGGVQLGQLPEDHAPRPDLLRRVLDARDGLPAKGEETVQFHVSANTRQRGEEVTAKLGPSTSLTSACVTSMEEVLFKVKVLSALDVPCGFFFLLLHTIICSYFGSCVNVKAGFYCWSWLRWSSSWIM